MYAHTTLRFCIYLCGVKLLNALGLELNQCPSVTQFKKVHGSTTDLVGVHKVLDLLYMQKVKTVYDNKSQMTESCSSFDDYCYVLLLIINVQ